MPAAKSPSSRAKKSPRSRAAPPSRASTRKPAPKSKPTPKPAAAAAGDDVGEAAGSEAAFHRYLPRAQALGEADLVPYRLDPLLAHHNVRVGIAAVAPHQAELRRALPLLDLDAVLDLVALSQAVVFADTQVAGPGGSTATLATLLAEGRELRGLLLQTAEALALGGVLAPKDIDKIRAGKGPIDLAQDCIALAALYRKHPATLAQQKLVQAKQLKRASELGTELLGRLSPGSARRGARPPVPGSSDRDRLGSLLWQQHAELRRAGYWIWGDALDAHVPPLQSRRRPPAKKPATPPATP